MARLNRRDFLKALGLAGATSLSACGLDDNWYATPVEKILPYVVKPEQVTPGAPTFFATTVTTGPNAWPVLGRHRDGRVINVGSNKQNALPHAVPKGAFYELQRHYSPDRLQSPTDGGAAATWDAALAKLAEAVKQADGSNKTVAYLGPYRSGALNELLGDFTKGNAIHWEPIGRSGEADAWEVLFGTRALPRYEVADAQYVLSFGAAFLGTWGGPKLAADFAKAKNPNHGNWIARFGLVSPHMDQTGGNADDWYACATGGQVAAAFGIAKLIAEAKSYAGAATSILSGVDPAASASAAGLTLEQLKEIADRFANAPAAVALPGAVPDADLAVATFLINVVSGNSGKTFLDGGYNAPVHSQRHVDDLIAQMAAGNVAVLLIDDSNPAYSLPSSANFAAARANVGMVVSLSGQPSETLDAKTDLVLPVSSTLEDWGDEDLNAHTHLLRQPTMSPFTDSRSLGDVLLATARAAGLKTRAAAPVAVEGDTDAPGTIEEATEASDTDAPTAFVSHGLGFEQKNWRDYVKARWERDFFMSHSLSGDFRSFWIKSLQSGGYQSDDHRQAPNLQPGTYTAPSRPAAIGVGVTLYSHPHRHDGRFANCSWSQEISDPMTGQVWDSWVEVSVDLAKELSLSDNDLVELVTSGGKVQLGVEVYRGLKGKSAALAFGQGHTASGAYANNRGVNAFALVGGDAKDSLGNVLMTATAAKITKVGTKAELVSVIGADTDGGRFWGVSVSADALAKVGDQPAAHPGDLTGIHHLPRDKRLDKVGRHNFYDPPDHPTYRFAMTVDTNACDGCGACIVACYAENNVPVVGKQLIRRGREMGWLRINRYWEDADGHDDVRFVPIMCQQCGLAPCESVCPVLATYHNIDGLNAMIYNRCVGTRYCANNCPYIVRRFNFHSYRWPQPLHMQLNPDVTVRTMGVMEKCTFCIQRTRRVKDVYRDKGFTTTVPDTALRELTACADACPTGALTFGNLNDANSVPAKTRKSGRNYIILSEFNTSSA
ncbi:MAG: Fe-S-cluster-containing dehydrogenase component/anaerobic selenocysteine-containing dehydrogenase, partial [Kiritimatiellia bacterium]